MRAVNPKNYQSQVLESVQAYFDHLPCRKQRVPFIRIFSADCLTFDWRSLGKLIGRPLPLRHG